MGPAAPADCSGARGVRVSPGEVVGAGTVLVDGTICPTRDWRDIPDLYLPRPDKRR